MAAGGVLFADGDGWIGLLVVFPVAGCLWVAGRPGILVWAGVAALMAGALHFRDVSARHAARDSVGTGRAVEMNLRVLETPRQAGRGWATRAEDVEDMGKVWLQGGGRPPERGEIVHAGGWLAPPEARRNPGEFDQRPWLDRLGVVGVLEAGGGVRVLKPAPHWKRFGDGVREGFRESVTRGLDPLSEEAAVIRAVVIGERPGDDMMIEPFRLTGTLHVFAVSGLHVGMVGVIGWFVMRLLGVPRRVALIPLALLMFGYAWLTGMKPPAMRAAWMATVILGAFWFRRRPDIANALGLAALLVLLTDGDLIFTAGVQLSFGVVGAIGLLHSPSSRCFQWIERTDPYLPRSLYGRWQERWFRIRQRTADLFTVSTSAWLGSAPLTIWHFGIVTPISILASVAISLIVLPLLGIALLSALCAPLPMVSVALNQTNALLARSVLRVAAVGAELPGGYFPVPLDRPADEFLIVYDLKDDGAAVWHGEGGTLLIDGGSRWSFENTVLPSVRRMALRPTSMVATHPDGGHVGGLTGALDAFPIRQGLAPVNRALGSNYRDWVRTAETRGVRLILGTRGVRYPLGGKVFLEVLHQPEPWNWHDLADGRVMPVRLEWHGWRILFMSDAGWSTEQAMLDSGIDLRADVIVAGRHARDLTLGSRFLDATGVRVIVATHAAFPPDERIPPSWRDACERKGISVFHQGESGAVTITGVETRLKLTGFVDHRTLELER